MKNRAKMISLLMALCMMITLLPAVAFAASGVASSVKIGGVELNGTYKWYVNGTNGAPGTAYDAEPSDWNAKFENGTLTLNGLIIVNRSSANTYRGIRWDGNFGRMLTIDLIAGTTNIVTNTQGSAVVGDNGYRTGASVTVQGSGTLVATGKYNGFWVHEKVTIKGDAIVIATGVTEYGIADNENYGGGSFVLEGNAKVYADGGKAGLSYKNESVAINGGSLVARGGTQAFVKAPDIASGLRAYVSSTINGATTDSYNSSLNSSDYKCVKIYGSTEPVRPNTGYVFFDEGDDVTSTGDTLFNTYSIGSAFNLNPNGFMVPNKFFRGWESISPVDPTGNNPYGDTAQVSNLKIPNTILYGKWADTHTADYYIWFWPNAQGVTGGMDFQYFKEGEYQAISPVGFNNPGKVFTGWNTKQDGSGTPYKDREVITLTEDIDLYAQWDWDKSGGGNTGGGNTGGGNTGIVDPGTSSGISLWYNGGNSFGSSNSAVPLSVEIDGVSVAFSGTGSQFTVGCISPNAQWVTVRWQGASVTTNFTPDANAYCVDVVLPKTGDVSVMAFALMAVIAAAGAMGKK